MKPSSSPGFDGRHWLLVLLVALSGAAALGHQLLWTRRLTDLLGASSESSVRVFGCFFLGLGLGSAAAAWKGGRFARPFRTLVWIELGIIALTIPILTLPAWTDWIWPALGPGALTDWRGSAVKLIVSFLVVTPPAILMGAGFPLLIRGALHDGRTMHRHGLDLYAGNTLGGVAGLLLAAVWLIPAAGSFGAIISCMGANAALAGAFWALDRNIGAVAEETVAAGKVRKRTGAGNPIAYRTILWLSFFSGAGVLAAEVAGLKMLMLAATISFHTPMAILCAVILTLGISACCVRPALRLAGSAAAGLPVFASLAGALLCVAPLIFMGMVTRENPFVGHASLWSFSLQLILVALASLGPALLFGGLIFPAALHWLGAEGDDARGRRLGWLMALNGLGGLIGAELAHGVLIPTLGVYRTFGCIGLAYVAVAAALVFRRGRRGVVAGKAATALAAAFSLLMLGKLGSMPHVNANIGFDLLAEKNGREGHLAVIRHPQLGKAILLSNQYMLGSESAKYDQERQAHLPLLLHPEPRRAGFIGHATGMTPGAALLHESVEEIVSIEIAQTVLDAATEHFNALNHGIAGNSRARLVNEDGRAYLAACDTEFDIVEGDLFLPWGPGVGRLYSLEHFRTVRRALRPGGVFCQWLPMYQLTPGQFDVIAATFHDVFPEAHLFRGTFHNQAPTLALVGFRDADLDWEAVARRCDQARAERAILDPSMRHMECLALLYLGRLGAKDGAARNTLDNLHIELDAAQTRLTGKPGGDYLVGMRWLVWMRDLDKKFDPAKAGGFNAARWAGLGFSISNWEETLVQKHPKSAQLRGKIRAGMPPALIGDASADWRQWPGSARP